MSEPSRKGHTYSGIKVDGGASHLGDVYQISAQPPGTLPKPSSTILPRSDKNFVNRDDLLQRLHSQASIGSDWVALVGLGGVGKTQIAIRYAKDLRERDDSIWVLWLSAANASRFDESLYDIAYQIRLPGLQDPKANILKLLQAWLADTAKRWVIILDNADNADFLLESPPKADVPQATKRRIDYIPSCDHGTVVITSRSKDEAFKFVDENSIIEVMPMDVAHALALLQKKLLQLYDEDNATKLATALEFVPLALSQAASFIKQKRKYSIETYLAELEKSRQSRTSLLRQHGTVPKQDKEASSSIILTWQISFEYIHNERKSAADLLALMSFCDRQAIPKFLLCDVKKSRAASEDSTSNEEDYEEIFDEDMQMLENFSFVSTTTNTTWDMHRLVQDAMQWWLSDHDRVEEIKRCYIGRLYMAMPTSKYENRKTYEILLPHSEIAITVISSEQEIAIQQADILNKMAWYAQLRGLFKDAISSAKKSLEIRTMWLGEENPDSVSSMHRLVAATLLAGLIKDAEELNMKVLDITKRVLGEEHPDTLTSMNDLGVMYQDQGRYEDAEKLYMKVLDSKKRVLGEEHPDTLASMGNLASTYHGRGQYEDAEKLYMKVIDGEKRVSGEEHPNTLGSMNNLALAYQNQGRYKDAEKLYVRVIDGEKRVLGEEHPDTLASMNNLASTYQDQGQYEDAEKLGVKAMDVGKKVLGEEHPDTLECMDTLALALTYQGQGRCEDAEKLGVKVMNIKRRVLGEEHPRTLESMSTLALTFFSQGKLQDALNLMKQCIKSRSAVIGSSHPDTVSSVNLLKQIEMQMQKQAGSSEEIELNMADLTIADVDIEEEV